MNSKILIIGLTLLMGLSSITNVIAVESKSIQENEIDKSIDLKQNIKNYVISSNDKKIYMDFRNLASTASELLKIKEEMNTKKIVMKAYPHSTFKAYMSWTALNPISEQYKFALKAQADPETAIMMYQGRYLVALGFAYASHIGQEIDVYMESGQVIPVVVGDWKAVAHTDQWQSAAVEKGDIIEFIVSSNKEAGVVVNGMGNYNGIFPGLVKEFRK